MYSVTEAFVSWLTDAGYSASTYPHKDSTGCFVTVERTGGGTADMIDHPMIAVQTWAPTEAEAEAMATAIRNALMLSSRPSGITRIDVNSGPYPFWDDYTGCPRYQTVYECTSTLI